MDDQKLTDQSVDDNIKNMVEDVEKKYTDSLSDFNKEYVHPNIFQLQDPDTLLCFDFEVYSRNKISVYCYYVNLAKDLQREVAKKDLKDAHELSIKIEETLADEPLDVLKIINLYNKLKKSVEKDISFIATRAAQILSVEDEYGDTVASERIGEKISSIAFFLCRDYISKIAFKELHDLIFTISNQYMSERMNSVEVDPDTMAIKS